MKMSVWLMAGVIGLTGCNLWRDYAESARFGSSGDGGGTSCSTEERTIDIEDGSITVDGVACPDGELRYEVSLPAGTYVDVELTHGEDELVWMELLDDRDTKVAIPAFGPTKVEFTELITDTGSYEFRVGGDADASFELHIATEEVPGTVYWIAPDGDDSDVGTAEAPWQTWPAALSALEPGDLLVARDGSWTDRSSCDGLPSPCLPDADLPRADCAADESAGTSEAPVVVAASRERQSRLATRGHTPAFEISRCAHWQLDGFSGEAADDNDGIGHVFRANESTNVVLRRLLARRANRDNNTYVIQVHESSNVRVVENEVYDFHKNAFMVSSSNDVTLLRNYANSRNTRDGAYDSTCSSRGDNGVSLWNSGRVTIANFVSEKNCIGVNVHATGKDIPDNGDKNLVWGSAALDHEIIGFAFSSSCDNNCSDDRVTSSNRLEHVVSIGAKVGVRMYGGNDNVVSNASSFDATNSGFTFAPGPDNDGGSWDATLRNASSVGDDGTGVKMEAVDLDVVAANVFGHPNFDGDLDGADIGTVDPEFENCRVYVPEASPLKGAGADGESIGAEMLLRHDGNAPIERALWDPRDGHFPCGARVEAINDNPLDSCSGVHERLAVGSAGCPLPEPF